MYLWYNKYLLYHAAHSPERTVHIAAKALILRAFSSLLAQRQIDSTHISRKPIARSPMYMNSLMTESQRTPGRNERVRGIIYWQLCFACINFVCLSQLVNRFKVQCFLEMEINIAPTLCLSWCQLNEAATLLYLIITWTNKTNGINKVKHLFRESKLHGSKVFHLFTTSLG